MPRPKVKLNEAEIRQIEALAGIGLTVEKISSILNIKLPTLKRRIKASQDARTAIERGRALAESQVSKTMFDMARSGDSYQASAFWLKCRAGWKDQEQATTININANEGVSRVVEELDADKLLAIMLQLKSLPPGEKCSLTLNSLEPSQGSSPQSSPQRLVGES